MTGQRDNATLCEMCGGEMVRETIGHLDFVCQSCGRQSFMENFSGSSPKSFDDFSESVKKAQGMAKLTAKPVRSFWAGEIRCHKLLLLVPLLVPLMDLLLVALRYWCPFEISLVVFDTILAQCINLVEWLQNEFKTPINRFLNI